MCNSASLNSVSGIGERQIKEQKIIKHLDSILTNITSQAPQIVNKAFSEHVLKLNQ